MILSSRASPLKPTFNIIILNNSISPFPRSPVIMPSLKTLSLIVLATAAAVVYAAATSATTFRTSDGKVVTMKFIRPGDIPNRVNITDLVFVSTAERNNTSTEPTTKRAAAPVDDTIAEPVAARLGKRDGLECYVPVVSANFEDCSGLCDFMQQYGANLALIPAFDDVY